MGDLMALGAMDCARNDLQLRVPEDVAVMGFDNIDAASLHAYNLTTIAQKIDPMLDLAFSYLKKTLDGEPIEGGIRLLSCSIVERTST